MNGLSTITIIYELIDYYMSANIALDLSTILVIVSSIEQKQDEVHHIRMVFLDLQRALKIGKHLAKTGVSQILTHNLVVCGPAL